MLFPRSKGDFGIYIKLNGRYVLYAHPDETFSEEHRQRLHTNGVEYIYVLTKQRRAFEEYLDANLGSFLLDDKMPIRERSKVFYSASMDIVQDTFETRLPGELPREKFDKVLQMVQVGSKFLAKNGSIKSLAGLIEHDYQTFSHCVHVFVFTCALLQTYDLDDKELAEVGLGAILHDIGKTQIPKSVLNKNGPLSKEERVLINSHPLKGMALCAKLPLGQDAVNCIMFHHEKINGTGYPTGLTGESIPLSVKAVAASDVYAALTTKRPYADARKPFEALSMMKEKMKGHFDPEVFRRLVAVLSGANII